MTDGDDGGGDNGGDSDGGDGVTTTADATTVCGAANAAHVSLDSSVRWNNGGGAMTAGAWR